MRRLPLLLLVVGSIVVSTLVTVSPARSAEDPLWYTSVDEAREAARASGRQILVDLYADWCIWCDKLDQIVFSRETFRETVGAGYVFLRVDVEQEEGEELQRRFRATNLPTTLLMTPDRIEIGRIQGFFPLDPFLDQIERQEQGWRDFQARYEAEVAVDDRDTLVLLATNLYDRGDGLRSAAIYRRLLPETTQGSGERARLAYQIAEALRRGGDLEAAETAFVQAEGAVRAASLEDSDLAARLSLLRFHIDHDRGECKAAVSSLERFLDRYPENRLAPPARTTLHKLKQSESCA